MIARSMRLAAACLALVLGTAACTQPEAPEPPALDVAPPRRAWVPDSPPQAVVLAVHGFNDYGKAFAEFGAYAATRGVAVHAYDQPGFGARPDAGLWPGTQALVDALAGEHARLRTLYPEQPIFLLGESMGAAVILAASARGALPETAGTILSAPAVWGGDQLGPVYRATLWVAVRLVPGLTLTGESLDVLPSDNLEMLRAFSRDPLVIKATRIDAVAGLVDLMDVAYGAAEGMPGPVLVLAGMQDEIVPPEAQAAMLERLTAAPCTALVYPQGYHMLLRDLQRRVVWDDVLAWIEGEPPPSGLAEPCGGSLSPVAADFARSEAPSPAP